MGVSKVHKDLSYSRRPRSEKLKIFLRTAKDFPCIKALEVNVSGTCIFFGLSVCFQCLIDARPERRHAVPKCLYENILQFAAKIFMAQALVVNCY